MLLINSIDCYKSEKVLGFGEAIKLIEKLKLENKTVGLCHGGFDLTHPGHVKHFESAKELCNFLFVSITSDKFVTCRKGSGRPIYNDKLRAYMVAAIKFVDYVIISNFKTGVEVIELLKPSIYIKGPDFINKTTPGITAEKKTIIKVGGEIKYTTEPPMSTTKIIEHIKKEVDSKELLIVIDRDGTLIENDNFLGKNMNWKKELKFNENITNYLSYLQTKYMVTKIVVTNQAGVARGLFDCKKVEKINKYINKELIKRGIIIDNWQYCPDIDLVYAELKKDEINFNSTYIKETTKRKPNTQMVYDALKELGKKIEEFDDIIVIGDREEDAGLANNLNAKFIDSKNTTPIYFN